ncbi:hypothetical protein [Olleya aquimaris]|uniref:O-antigen ligase domain-containing protein n=1 Tax=Olleya aquimaris TaxID=639310 RepID=A0A327RPN2_9FLAO|nr:hypothetical protein [Olleya aquimaris]RAJ17902.1 hypothetical protein LY08_00172 [Olleya aquimaris]
MLKEVSHFKIVTGVIVALFFFPSITFGLLQAEVFPWGIILSTYIILRQKKINKFYILFLASLLFNVVVFSLYYFPDIKIPEVVRSLLAYINSSICFVAFYQASKSSTLKTIKLVKVLFVFLIALGLFQYLGLLKIFDPVFKFLIPRASSEALARVRRGVTLLATEPARAGVSLVFLYVVVRTVFVKSKKIISDILFLFFLTIIIKSIMALGVFFVFILITYRAKLIRFLAVGLIVMFLIDLSGGGGRSEQMIRKIKDQKSFGDATMVVVDLAGPRLISVYSSWLHTFSHPIGGGIGHWEKTSVDALLMTGIDFSEINYFKFKGNSKAIPTRSSGYVSNLVLDTGFFGVFVFFVFLYSILNKYWKIDTDAKNIIILFLFKIMFIGSVGPPDAWIATIISLKYLHYKALNKA